MYRYINKYRWKIQSFVQNGLFFESIAALSLPRTSFTEARRAPAKPVPIMISDHPLYDELLSKPLPQVWPHGEVNQIQMGQTQTPHLFWPKPQKMVPAPVLSHIGCVKSGSVLLKDPQGAIFKVILCWFQHRLQNVVDVRFCVNF